MKRDIVAAIELRAERREAMFALAHLGFPIAVIARVFGTTRCKVKTALRRETRVHDYVAAQALLQAEPASSFVN